MSMLNILIGLPGSGKTTYAKKCIKENSNAVHISSDNIRKELYGDEAIQGDTNEVFSLMKERTLTALKENKYVYYDATNMTRKDRSHIISACKNYYIEATVVWAPYETCVKRDSLRERSVGESVIKRMIKRFQAPYTDEGLVTIGIVSDFNNSDSTNYIMKCWRDMEISHENPHHTLNIQEHCAAAYTIAKTLELSPVLCQAAQFHDIGKPFCKDYIDNKGNPCDIAHYYNHENVSGWMAYGILKDPYFAWLISNHMEPYHNSKYYRRLPEFMKKDLDLLHEADKGAH